MDSGRAGAEGGFSERMIQQCFDKIGQSLDQLATKDRLIQQLISDKQAGEKRKQDLRHKLKSLRGTLMTVANQQ